MKLWQKISLACVIVLLLVIIVCSVLLLCYAKGSILDLTIQQTKARQENLHRSFESMAAYYIEPDDAPAAKRAVVKYCFQRFADETSVLTENGETIYSQVSVEPKEWLDAGDGQSVWKGEISGRNVLIAGSAVQIGGDRYGVYTVEDITPVYKRISDLMWRFAAICGAGAAVGTALIILIVRRASKPLSLLRETARRIAAGNYAERTKVAAKDEIGALSEDFNTMAEAVERHVEQLEDTAQRQKLLLGGLTHEFKTPLTSLLLYSETLLMAELPEQEKEKALVHINTQCRWLESLTQKMMRLITLDGLAEIRQSSVRGLFEDVCESIRPVLAERGTPLVVQCRMEVLPMDCDLMKTLLVNLIDNASKASARGQTVFLRAYENTIEVKDGGTGIPESELDRVTDAFYMVDRSRSKAKGGSGLGLALVARIAQAHGARLVIKSKEGEGTSVKIIFGDNKTITF